MFNIYFPLSERLLTFLKYYQDSNAIPKDDSSLRFNTVSSSLIPTAFTNLAIFLHLLLITNLRWQMVA